MMKAFHLEIKMKNKIILFSYLLVIILTLYSLSFEHGLYGIYTDLMLSNVSVNDAFNSIILISCIAVVVIITTAYLSIFLIKKNSFSWLLMGTFFIQGYIYGMIILDHHRLKKEPNDGFTYPIIFEKYGILADIVISSPFIMILISITIIMFYINKK